LREDVVIGSSDSDEDYDEEGEAFSDSDDAEEVLSQRRVLLLNGSLISIH
jgi:hypothetical protein